MILAARVASDAGLRLILLQCAPAKQTVSGFSQIVQLPPAECLIGPF
jgi:hypothetical protein